MNKIKIAYAFNKLGAFVGQIDNIFIDSGDVMHAGRNTLKRFQAGGVNLCVKSFGRPTIANIFIYSFFRKTKAERSFLYAQKLLDRGIRTPRPVAYVVVRNRLGLLKRSYYISVYDKVDYTMLEVLENEVPNKQAILNGFVRFMADELHPHGVYHHDFNGGNVLVTKGLGDNYHYSLVDLNRIQFGREIGYALGLKHLRGISDNPVYLAELARFYSAQHKVDANETIYRMLFAKYIKVLQRRYTKRFLHSLKAIF